MVRGRIISTLIYKEFLRYRYNWGLLIVVAALLALSALVSVASRSKNLAAFGVPQVVNCSILYRQGTRADDWVAYLRRQPEPKECTIHFVGSRSASARPVLKPDEMAIELVAPTSSPGVSGAERLGTWTARYWYPGIPPVTAMPVRDWFVRASNDFLGSQPRLREETANVDVKIDDRLPLVVTPLAIFAVYLLSFNLYITSTGEEREKRILLGLLLTPATALEMVAAKAIFYTSASVVVTMSVVGMYQPRLLLNPFLPGAIVCGSVCYVAIGTIVVSIVRRQTTINTISLLYLIATSIVIILAQFLPLFTALKLLLVENYLHGIMKMIIGGEAPSLMMKLYLLMLIGFAVGWSILAVLVFSKQGTAIARAR